MFLGKFKYRVDEGDIDKPLRGKQFQEVFDDNPCRVPWLRERMIEKMEAGEMPSVHLRAFIAFCDYMEGKLCVACGKTIVKRGPTRSNGAFYRKHPWWTTYHVKCYELRKSKKDPKE